MQDTIKLVKRPTKINGYSSNVLNAKRQRKSNEAKERQEIYDDLPVAKKIKLVKSRRGESKRELARLEKRLTAKQ